MKPPLVIFIPGSAWYRQEMYNSVPSYAKLAEMGFVTAVVQYRESKIAKYPAQVEDMNYAIDFLMSKAEDFHIDTKNVFLAGNSSGGHIALMTAFRRANGIFDGKVVQKIKLRGVIAVAAPADIFLCQKEKIPEYMPKEFRPTKDLLGVNEISDNIAMAQEASCEKYIKNDIELPPVLLVQGTQDEQVSIHQSRQLYEKLEAHGKKVVFYEITNGRHGGALFWSKKVYEIYEKFMREEM